MPTRAPAPPASRLKSLGDQRCSSPTRRNNVTARVTTAGTPISRRMETVAIGPDIALPPELQYFFAVHAPRTRKLIHKLAASLGTHVACRDLARRNPIHLVSNHTREG